MNTLDTIRRIVGLLLLIGTGAIALAQYPDRLDVRLPDSTQLTLVRAGGLDLPPGAYQYLPAQLMLSEREGEPEISFLAYRRDSLEPIDGGILHVLLRWGLQEGQLTALDSALRQRTDSLAFVMGSMLVAADPEHPNVEIGPEENEIAAILRRSLRSAAQPPLYPGGKLAMSFQLDGPDATRLEAAWGDPQALGEVYFRIYLRPALRSFAFRWPESFYLQTKMSTWKLVP